MSIRALVLSLALSLALVACGGDKKARPAPEARPFTGAPVLVEAKKVGKDSVDVEVYNFGDKPVVSYWFLVRYKDADGKVLKVKPGTPFEGETDHMSMSGNAYQVAPKSWKSLTIDMLEVPEGAATAEVIVRSVSAEGLDEPLWELPGGGFDWPAEK